MLLTGSPCRRNLQLVYMAQERKMTLEDVTNIDILLERLSNPVAFRPIGAFELNFSFLVKALLVMMTNIFILLQFKFGES